VNFQFIDGTAKSPPAQPISLPALDKHRQLDPAGYIIDNALVDAVNVSLLLCQPLLITGDPGTGKTQLAYRVAWELGLPPPLRYDTKSTSTARDLFYSFDTLSRFHAANTNSGSQRNIDYITYNALGRAILLSKDPRDEEIADLLPFKHPGKTRHVVLIDEVDKAPRDFPNDLLNEIENMTFRVTELGNVPITADDDSRPILILTSNSEKNLPDAFLRRCIYFHIPFPDRRRLEEIITSRVPSLESDGVLCPLLEEALDLFLNVRELDLRKPPSPAELINWVTALTASGARPDQSLKLAPDALKRTITILVKTRDDIELITQFVERYVSG
jgi:MoxR-like ATPase